MPKAFIAEATVDPGGSSKKEASPPTGAYLRKVE